MQNPPGTACDTPLFDDALASAAAAYREGRFDACLANIRRALVIAPANAPAQHVLSAALWSTSHCEAATMAVSRIVIANAGDNPGLVDYVSRFCISGFNKMVDLYREGRHAETLALVRSLSRLPRPVLPEPFLRHAPAMMCDISQILFESGCRDTAMDCLTVALSLDPAFYPAMLQRAYLHLSRKDYATAWDQQEWRRCFASQARRLWDGSASPGSVLVFNSNGFGDFIQFMRFLPQVRALAADVRVALPESFRKLVATSPLMDGVGMATPGWEATAEAACDIIALPYAMGLVPDDAVPPFPYLHPPADRVAAWRCVIDASAGDAGALRVGVVWARKGDDAQSIGLQRLLPLANTPGVHLFGLQNNAARNEMLTATLPDNFTDLGVFDWLNLASAMAGMDLIIAPDCGMAHLAGALGLPVWVMLQRYSEWRWTWEDEASDWYPSARLFRQAEKGDWDPVVTGLGRALRQFPRKVSRPGVEMETGACP
jgi:tetratricopeptide (TPR) repeat protein